MNLSFITSKINFLKKNPIYHEAFAVLALIFFVFSHAAFKADDEKHENNYPVISQALLLHPINNICTNEFSVYIEDMDFIIDGHIAGYECLMSDNVKLHGKILLERKVLNVALNINDNGNIKVDPLIFSRYLYENEGPSIPNSSISAYVRSNQKIENLGSKDELLKELIVILNLTELEIKRYINNESKLAIRVKNFKEGI